MAASVFVPLRRPAIIGCRFRFVVPLMIGCLIGCGGEPMPQKAAAQQIATVPDRSGDASVATAPGSAGNSVNDPSRGADAGTDADARRPSAKDSAESLRSEEEEQAVLDQLFAQRKFRAPSLEAGTAWINAAGPIDLKDLHGKFVLLDFWTFCCINCMHVLPELKQLEKDYPNNLVVIGVHSAKFEAEQDSKNITEAVLRYEIEHPVVNDPHQAIWESYEVQSWPTIVLIDPEGYVLFKNSGETKAEVLENVMRKLIPYYRKKGLLSETPLRFDLERYRTAQTPLRFPGKIVADEAGDRLFISDSNHNRIVVTRLDGTLLDVIGAGDVGKTDGDYKTARFNRPQGMAFVDDILYVADTENHLLRKVDLKIKQVVTIAGTGRQAENGWPGWHQAERSPFDLGEETKPPLRYAGQPRTTALSSPWDLAIRKRESGRGPSAIVKSSEKKGAAPLSTGRSPAIVGDLFIAMAGTHQVWRMPLDEAEIGPFAGNSREDIVNGPLLPRQPYAAGFASFAQPSGLALDGNRLYVADSEASSIRNVPLGIGEVRTVVGTAALSHSRLFTFGDVDGEAGKVRLQHPLGVAFHDGKIYVADTYNNKVKVIDASRRVCKSLVGSGEPGHDDSAIADGAGATFSEPSGLCYAAGKLYVADTNNHLIRTIDIEHDLRVATLQIPGLAAPEPQNAPTASKPSFNGAEQVQLPEAMVKPTDGAIRLAIKFTLPAGYKMNPLAPLRYYLEADGATGPIDRGSLGKLEQLDHPSAEFEIKVPIRQSNGRDALRLSMNYYYCQERAQGLCKVGAVEWTIPIALSSNAAAPTIEVPLEVTK